MKPILKKVTKPEERYLIATDLDGTFLAHGGNMTHHIINTQVVKKIKELGHKFVLASGRSPQLMTPTYKHLELETPMVSFHGGLITDPTGTHTDLELNDQKIPVELIQDVVSNTDIIHHTIHTEYIGNGKSNQFTSADDIKLIDYDCYELVFSIKTGLYTKEDADKILNPWSNKIDWFFMSGSSGMNWDMILIVPIRVNKKNALERLSMYYMIPQERIIYFGDNSNDIEALKYAGHGVAMISGIENAKKNSNAITDFDSSQGGVGRYILDYLIEK